MEPRFKPIAKVFNEFPHAFSMYGYEGWDPATRQQQLQEIWDWCRERFGGPAIYWWGNRWHCTPYAFHFRHHTDAMHFKLRWT